MHYPFHKLLRYELSLFLYDKWLLASVTIIPAVLMLLICSIFQQGIIRDLPVAVVDMNNSTLSRRLTRAIDATEAMQVQGNYLNMQEAAQAMRGADVYMLVYIEPKFAQKVIKHESPSVDAFYNTQFILVGRTLVAQLQKVVTTLSIGASVQRNLMEGNVRKVQALGNTLPIQQQITPLYNLGSRYDQFLLSVIIPCIWQILIMVVMVLSFSAQHRRTGITFWIDRTGLSGFVAKLVVYQVIFLGMGVSFLYYLYQYLGWPMQGSWSILVTHQYLMVVATQAVASLIYFITLDPARALSFSASYVAPALAFVGITFPVNSMMIFPKIWRSLLPVTHYMQVQVTQVNYGLSAVQILPYTLHLMLFSLFFILVWLRIHMLQNSKYHDLLSFGFGTEKDPIAGKIVAHGEKQ